VGIAEEHPHQLAQYEGTLLAKGSLSAVSHVVCKLISIADVIVSSFIVKLGEIDSIRVLRFYSTQ
jgi:hypothetical protein